MEDKGNCAKLLEVSNVSKTFPGVKALDSMRLDVRRGEVLALIGENGAGKSTLMKVLSGIVTPDSGELSLFGGPYQPRNPKHAQELGVGIIHQELNLMPDLSIARNIYIGNEPRKFGMINERRINEGASRALERVGLDLDPRVKVENLSVAQQQMVEIAKALTHNSRLLILDEPTAALNDEEVENLHNIIRKFVTEETGAIYISHRMDELKAISNRITVIRDGEYINTVDTQEATLPEVITMMVGRDIAQEQRSAINSERTTEISRKPMLSVKGLSTSALLKDISFEVHSGEILGFAGLMGAGRTEVARAIVGADPMSAGTVSVNGKPVHITNTATATRHGIGYLSEDRKKFGLMLEQSVRDNIVLTSLAANSRLGYLPDKKLAEIAQGYVKQLRIKTPSVNQLARNLSGGNQQKVVIAKWLMRDCDILIFDEPTRGIDVGAKEEIYTLLDDLAAAGKSIIMISSELPEVLRMSDRIMVMSEGRITGELSRNEATQESIMEFATMHHTTATARNAVSAAQQESAP